MFGQRENVITHSELELRGIAATVLVHTHSVRQPDHYRAFQLTIYVASVVCFLFLSFCTTPPVFQRKV